MSKSILIVTYIFPPFPSVGGRRWLKFAKFLSKEGFDVHVIYALNPLKTTSPWTHELTKIHHVTLHPISGRYPKILLMAPRFFHQRLLYKIVAKFLQTFFKGHTYDWSLLWKTIYLKKAREVIRKNNISVVITSGAPFHTLHHSLQLKKDFPYIKIVSDFRDLWVENLKHQKIPEKRLAYERHLEKEVIDTSDLILTVSETMTQKLRTKAAEHRRHTIRTLHNGFDPDDVQITTQASSSKIKLIYTGELYAGIKHLIEPFAQALLHIQQNNPELFSNLNVEFYGDVSEPYELNPIQLFSPIPRNELNQKLNGMTAGIVFLPDHADFALSTKFVEYIGYRKPLLVISKYGPAAEFVEKNKIGYWLNPDDFLNSFSRALDRLKFSSNAYAQFSSEAFSVQTLTQELIHALQVGKQI